MSGPERPELLDGLSDADARKVLDLCAPLALAGGEVLFPLGAEADRLFLVRRGRIVLSLPLRVQGREQDTFVEEKAPGETVGWSAMVPPHRFTLKAAASIDSEVLVLPRAALLGLFEGEPRIGCTMARNLAGLVGRRLHSMQAMWLRELQRLVDLRYG